MCSDQRIRISRHTFTRCSDAITVKKFSIEIQSSSIRFVFLCSENYQQLLLTQWNQRFKEILSQDNYTQMIIEDETKYQLLLRQFPLRIEAIDKVS